MELIVSELVIALFRWKIGQEINELMAMLDNGQGIPPEMASDLVNALIRHSSQERAVAVFGEDIIDVDPDTGEVLNTPMLPAMVSQVKNELITSDQSVINVTEYGRVRGVNAVVEHRPFMTTPIEEYNVTEGLMAIIIALLFVNAIKSFFTRFW
jgi:hypothetical protein